MKNNKKKNKKVLPETPVLFKKTKAWLKNLCRKVWNMPPVGKKRYVIPIVIYIVLNINIVVQTIMVEPRLGSYPCLSEACLDRAYQHFPNLIGLNAWLLTTSAVIVAVLSLRVNVSNLKTNRKTSLFNNHIGNFKFFSEHIMRYISTRSHVNSKDVDISYLYYLMFPESTSGFYDVSKEYSNIVSRIRKYLITTSNSSKNSGPFDYRTHQNRMIKELGSLGISVVNMHKKDFFLVERELFDLIDSVTKTFTGLSNKHYLTTVDIHYN